VVVSSSTAVDVAAAVVEVDVAAVESRAAVALDVVVGTGASGHLFLHSPIILKGIVSPNKNGAKVLQLQYK
jgi:hypothetical protein